jgi:hypothetical protein
VPGIGHVEHGPSRIEPKRDEIDVFTTQDGTYPCGPIKEPSILDRFNARIINTSSWNDDYNCVGYGAGIVDFSVLYRDTNQQWVTVQQVTGNTRVWSRFSVLDPITKKPVLTDAVRIVVTNGMLNAARIVQVEAWGW